VSTWEKAPGQDRSSGESQNAPAGWYPDPRGSGQLFYWDGSRWTGDVHRAARPESAKPTQPRERASKIVIGGGVALAISPFLTWVKVILLGNLSLFQLFDAAGRSSALAWGAVVAGGAAAVVAFRDRNPTTIRGTGLVVGLLGGALALYALVDLREELREAHGLATVGIGPYIAVGGCLAMVIGALMSKRKPATLR
jgi:Protein of unknown function (DUF2510)